MSLPVSNLYEAFVLFAIITALIYLFHEGRYRSRELGSIVLLVISSAVAFLLWYSFTGNAAEIQPLLDENPCSGKFYRLWGVCNCCHGRCGVLAEREIYRHGAPYAVTGPP